MDDKAYRQVEHLRQRKRNRPSGRIPGSADREKRVTEVAAYDPWDDPWSRPTGPDDE